MKTLVLQGVRGGVGTTSLVAAIAQALVQQGERVLCLDLDPRNLLRLHFGQDLTETCGWGLAWTKGRDWTLDAFQSESNLHFLPYGNVSAELIVTLDRELSNVPDWWQQKIACLSPQTYDWLLIDSPLGMPGHQQQARRLADSFLHICQTDAACHILMEPLRLPAHGVLLINRFSPISQLQQDLRVLWQQRYGQRLLSEAVHQDESVMESLAHRQNVCRYQPESQAARDIQRLAAWCLAVAVKDDRRVPRNEAAQ